MTLDDMLAAAKTNDAAAVRTYLGQGGDIDAAGADGNNALVWAAHSNAHDVLRLLLERGANLDVKSGTGFSPEDVAARAQNAAGAALLKEARLRPATEHWVTMGTQTVAHVGTYRDLNKKITQVFNFATRERVLMTENLQTKVELLSQPTSFDALPRSALDAALTEFTQRGGVADRDFVLDGNDSLGKARITAAEKSGPGLVK